jgi:hypothetical protein
MFFSKKTQRTFVFHFIENVEFVKALLGGLEYKVLITNVNTFGLNYDKNTIIIQKYNQHI